MLKFPPADLAEFYRTYNIYGFQVSEDEKHLAFATNLSGQFNLWGMDLPNTYPYPITREDQVPRFFRFSPNADFLIVGFDHDGDEFTQIYAVSRHGGSLVPIRMSPGTRYELGAMTEDGSAIYYTADKDNALFMNVYRYDLATEEERTVVVGDGAATEFAAVASDESSLTFFRQMSNTLSIPYVLINDEQRCLTPDENQAQSTTMMRYLDADTILLTTNYGSNFHYLAQYRISSGVFKPLFVLPEHDVMGVHVQQHGQTIWVQTVSGVQDELYKGDIKNGNFEKVTIPGAVIYGYYNAPSGSLYVLVGQENRPQNLYVRDVEGHWTELTASRVMGVSENDMVLAETIRFPSYDGLEIEALFYRAHPDRDNHHTIIMPHGGPQAAERKYFWSLTQFLLYRGYSIFAPNFRGSVGYGAQFMQMVERDWGGGARQDMVYGIDWLLNQGLAERDKLFVLGASYGGYMALMLHGRHSQYFRAVVDIFGPSNLLTFIDSVPESWKPMMDLWIGNPQTDRDKLLEDSPITYLEDMIQPMLVIQGAHDPRVVKAESDQIVQALRQRGRQVEYIVLEDEGHGFSKKDNELKVYQAVVDFLDRHRA